MDYPARLTRLRRSLKSLKCDALVVSHGTNVKYLAGFTGTSGMAVVLPGSAYFITDFRYQAQAAQQVPAEYAVAIAKKGLWGEAAAILKGQTPKGKVGFESEHTSVATFEELQKEFKPLTLVSTLRAVEKLRLVKESAEMDIMRRAIKIADDTFVHLCKNVLKPGVVESDVAAEIERFMKSQGASGTSFDTIVASGVRGALPHGVASNKRLAAGEMVTVDMGARYAGYCSDLTRTVCLGKPTRDQQKVYETVWIAQKEAAAQMRPGLACKAADKVARDIITAAGYGEHFGHGLGHGVGLDIHEQPRVSFLGKGKLEVGNVVSCEPGIYLPDWGGVRIEDLVLITKDGGEILSKCPKPRKIMVI